MLLQEQIRFSQAGNDRMKSDLEQSQFENGLLAKRIEELSGALDEVDFREGSLTNQFGDHIMGYDQQEMQMDDGNEVPDLFPDEPPRNNRFVSDADGFMNWPARTGEFAPQAAAEPQDPKVGLPLSQPPIMRYDAQLAQQVYQDRSSFMRWV